ncbi:MAG: hypothetical protein K2J99_17045 [Lachnospiraceae bacterium]|nr:hypothetical protein [Lachnospiraceae bacterium]
MNYLWEVLLQAQSQGMKKESVKFCPARSYSPYMELAEEYLNITRLEEPCTVEVNPNYRFQKVFQTLFHPDITDYPALRIGLFQLLFHQLGENDIRAGMTREEYYKKLLGSAFARGDYGTDNAEAYALFQGEERQILLEGLLTLYREGDSIELFRHVMTALIPRCIVYGSNDDPYELLIYIGRRKSETLERKVQFVLKQFMNIRYQAELYYEYHFGIIGMEETMHVDEIAIC